MQCPSCHKEVTVEDKNIGALFTCPLCQSVYFINFDGTADYGSSEVIDSEQLENLIQEQTDQVSANNKKHDQQDHFQNLIPNDSENNNKEGDEQSYQPADFEQNFEVADIPISTNENVVAEISNEISAIENTLPSEHEKQNESLMQETFNSISEFGNQETTFSGLTYHLHISEIDTPDLQRQTLEAFEDKRLQLDIDQIKEQVKNGEVYLQKLTAVKAFCIQKNLELVDVNMTWSQNVLE